MLFNFFFFTIDWRNSSLLYSNGVMLKHPLINLISTKKVVFLVKMFCFNMIHFEANPKIKKKRRFATFIKTLLRH